MTVPEPNELRQLDTFPHLRNCTPKLPPQPASCTLLAFHRAAHPWLFLHCQLLHTLFALLIVLFMLFSVSVVLCLLVYRVFFCVSVLAKPSTLIFPWEPFLYSGFAFSHDDLSFPTRYCIPYVRSGLYQVLICVKGFCVSTQWPRLHIAFRFCPSAWTPCFQRVEFLYR